MVVNIHAGHNADGQKGCGAVGYVSESIENRLIKDAVIKYLLLDENIVYDSTVDYAGNQTKNLVEIVKKCNKDLADINVSIHLNAGAKDLDDHTTGVEVYVYDEKDVTYSIAQRICNNIARLGYCNRGVKVNKNLYVLKNTKAPALLIECFFIDDKNDVDVYKRTGVDKFGKAIAEAIVNHTISDIEKKKTTTVNANNDFFVKVIVDSLNVRQEPNVQSEINGCINDKGVYTIVEVVGNWGKLKSGTGWINISSAYCKRV